MVEQKNAGMGVGAAVLVVLVLIALVAIYKYKQTDEVVIDAPTPVIATSTMPEPTATTTNPVMEAPTSTTATTTVTTTPAASEYKDGTYETMGNYKSPAGPEEIDVTLTLKDDVVTDATVVSKATNPRSVMMQGMFVANYKTLVIGKKLDELNLDKVSGSSLTPKGFNEAVAEIKVQAARS